MVATSMPGPRSSCSLLGDLVLVMYSDKAACLLLGQAQSRWVCTVPVAAGHQQSYGFAGVAQTPLVAFVSPAFLLDT